MRPIEFVEREVWDLIKRKELVPGERITESLLKRKIREDLKGMVSQTVVREGLQKMAYQGIFHLIPFKGCTLVKLTEDDIREINKVRKQLEVYAMKLGYENLQSDSERKKLFLKNLEKIVQQMKDAVGKEDGLESYMENHQEFHRNIWNCSDNWYLERTLDKLTNPLFHFYQIVTAQGEEVPNDTYEAHLTFLDFYEGDDADKAEGIVERHLSRIDKPAVAEVINVGL